MKRRLGRAEVSAEPHVLWEAFVDLLAREDSGRLNPQQRPTQLAYWYDAEVQKAGHLQYFANAYGNRAAQTVTALEQLGAHKQGAILTKAIELAGRLAPNTFETSKDFLDAALGDAYGDFDRMYADCAPTVRELLEQHLREHEADFIEWAP